MDDFDLTQDEWDALTQLVWREPELYIDAELLTSLQKKGMLTGHRPTDQGVKAVSTWEPPSEWDYTKDGKVWKSAAVVVSDGTDRNLLLHAYGPAIDWHIDQVGSSCQELGLHAPGPGIWVWEGSMGAIRHDSPITGEDWDYEVQGDWRVPTPEEWELVEDGECPWDKETLPKWPISQR